MSSATTCLVSLTENEFSLEEIQENSDSFLLDINEEEGIIARKL